MPEKIDGAPTTKFIRFEFYRVSLPDGEKTFVDLLEGAQKVDVLSKRVLAKDDAAPVRWEFLETSGTAWVGDITRIRDTVIPNKASRKSPRERLVLKEDEGTTEDTVFAYLPELNVLVCHSNRFGVTGHDIVNYFVGLAGKKIQYDAFPVLSLKAVQDFENFQSFDKVRFKVARPKKNLPMPKTGIVSVDSCIDAASKADAAYFDLTLGVGRFRRKLVKEYVIKIFGALMKMAAAKGPVKILEATGLSADGQADHFDFLQNRLQSRQQVTISKDRDLTYEERKRAVLAACKICLPELEGQFGPED